MDVILLASGTGSRTNLSKPKQMLELGGKPILYRLIDFFYQISFIDNIIITTNELILTSVTECVCKYSNVKVIIGGKTRQQSVYKALSYVKTKEVMIHEAARPFIDYDLVKRIFDCPKRPVVPYTKSTSTLYNINDSDYVNRDYIVNIQLPQIYCAKDLRTAHRLAIDKTYPDDSSLLFGELNIRPNLVEGSEYNIKITTPFDVDVSEVLYEKGNCCRGE
jgi:2-C-methyl-D-erythritol 4-phosphate cytidylyltransferase